MLIIHALAASWAQLPELKEKSLRWGWFREAFRQALDAPQTSSEVPRRVNDEALAGAFFAWVKAVEAYGAYESLDKLDFRHFMAALMLQKLVAADPPVTEAAVGGGTVALVRGSSQAQSPGALVPFVMTLLQAWRLELGAPALVIAPELMQGRPWASFLENVREDSSTAIGFVDQLSGLEPVWQYPTLIESRPAVKKAMGGGGGAHGAA
ncbi:MAG: hypothetical protein V4731_16320 [Pseudomonadota bacterium]